jgi:CheY-like chemotaxis protein
MPIVDGLTSTKMIRSFEKSHPTHLLSTRASLNGRVPVIAVSATLVERERQTYVDAGFDGWLLKPIAFNRLTEITKGIVDGELRKENLYKPGAWEMGGWFDEAQKDIFAANTKPSGKVPMSAPGVESGSEGVRIAAAVDDPMVKEEDSSEQSQEQERMAKSQERQQQQQQPMDSYDDDDDDDNRRKVQSMPELGRAMAQGKDSDGREPRPPVTDRPAVASPQPMTPNLEDGKK